MKDHFATLGLDRNASQEDVKKAYRKAALEHHPDRGGSEDKFKEIQQAYENISKGQGIEEDPIHHQFSHMNMNDVFSQFFGGQGFPFGGMNFHFQHARHPQTKRIDVPISFEEAYNGCFKVLVDTNSITCSCMKVCEICRGRGHIIAQSFGMISVQIPCNRCAAKGTYSSKSDCHDCKNTGTITQEKKYRVSINPGVLDKSELSMPTTSSDISLIFVINIQPSIHNFTRVGNDLVWQIHIDWIDSVVGKQVVIPHPSSTPIEIHTSQFGPLVHLHEYKLEKKGFKHQTDEGDLILKFYITNVPKIKFEPTDESQFRDLIQKLQNKNC